MSSIELEGVTKAYLAGQAAVRDVTLEVRDGELLVLVGPSGSGKSTILRLIAGLEEPTAGRVRVGGRDVTDLPPQERDLAMVFQTYALYPHKTVRDNLAFGLKVRGVGRAAIAQRVAGTAAALGIEALLDRRPAQLSGGQRQRVALGRALVREPRAFLLDEPLSNLDPQLRVGTRAELALLHRRLGATMVYVTHDQEEAMTLGERVAVMRDGAVIQVAPPLDLYHAPANTFVASFIGSPAMNLWVCRRAADGAWTSGTLRLGDGGGVASAAGGEIVVGVRPHDVTIVPDHADLEGVVEVLEPFGATSLAHVRTGDGEPLVRVVVPGDVRAAAGHARRPRAAPGPSALLRRRHGPAARRMRRPVSSYRLQFGRDFTFVEARELVPYLAALGVTECYCSPFLKAGPGSPHGYDICDHNAISDELGGEAAYLAFSDALGQHGLGQIVDFVPNHMGIDLRSNPWWRDVLENGPSSPFADFFDIEWDPVKPELHGKILLPILADQYGLVLERGELELRVDAGTLVVAYQGQDVPINPRRQPVVLSHGLDVLRRRIGDESADLRELQSILAALGHLPAYTERDPRQVAERRREKETARARLARLAEASPPVREHLAKAVQAFNGRPGDARSFDRLHKLLDGQAYRLASWRAASDEINYRRFFDINELAGLRMERLEVREATHGLLWRLVEEGRVTGVRIDHIDGLFDPFGYLTWLRETSPRAVYVVAEKILSARETLPDDWPVDGTTGYDFLNDVIGLFIDRERASRMRRVYVQVTGRREAFGDVVYDSKRLIQRTALASELNVLAHALNRISEHDRRCRDFTLNSLRKTLAEVVANFPVYRTYVRPARLRQPDRDAIDLAVARARHRTPAMEASTFSFLTGALLAEAAGAEAAGEEAARLAFAMKFQQYTGPVQAKGLEDTAFYRYNLLLALNEVGGDPPRFGRSLDEFHDANRARLARWPLAMTTTATHDTKRGEDARTRIAVLSEIPDDWRRAVSSWLRLNASSRTVVEGEPAPTRNDEYGFYQTLVGAWPAEPIGAPLPAAAPAEFVGRVKAFMRKATKESKTHTSWINPNGAYDSAVETYVDRVLSGPRAARFLASFVPFARRIARLGMTNSLAQLVLKIASPGVPDFYQGAEVWDLSLVDPDNRRPVDYAGRRAALERMQPSLARIDIGGDAVDLVADLARTWEDGRIKLFVTARGLHVRRADPDLFLKGEYIPLAAEGPASRHVVAFARRLDGACVVALTPRLVARLEGIEQGTHGEGIWSTTRLLLPWGGVAACRNLLTGERVPVTENGTVAVGDALRICPVALLRISVE